MRLTKHFFLENPNDFKQRLLAWSNQFREVVFLDSNAEFNQDQKYSSFDFALAADAFTSIETDSNNAFEDLKQYQQTTQDWIFGYLNYDLKNDIENLFSKNFDGLGFAELYFFQPKKLFIVKQNQLEMQYLYLCDDDIDYDFHEIINFETHYHKNEGEPFEIKQRISEPEYHQKVASILKHIQQGEVYEVNFCMEFFATNANIDPAELFVKLNQISNAPFSCFFKKNKHFLMSASPERYLKKMQNVLVSQPIKGTAARFMDFEKDTASKNKLLNDPKERSENIMITDLVRNDLSRTACKGTVKVEELCGLYSFSQVHQLITTITSEIDAQFCPIDLLKSTFPMGSMTGAPKIAAMNIIENMEQTKRGLYSGAVGYFSPIADFDFNVVIRSMLYDAQEKYVSFSVGSAITSLSNSKNEYQECLLKAQAMLSILEN